MQADIDGIERGSATSVDDEVIDASVIEQMRAVLGEETVLEVILAFLAGTHGFAESLRDCLQNHRVEDAVFNLHRMVGSAAAIGAVRLSASCQRNEQILKATGSTAGLVRQVDAIEQVLDQTVAALLVRVPVQSAGPNGAAV